MSTVMVTGATGFIGRHLVPALTAHGHRVRAAYRGLLPPQPKDPNVEWVGIEDIGPDTEWSDALRGVDVVVHLAGVAHKLGREARGLEAEYGRVNSEGTRRLAEAVGESPTVSRLLVVSSIAAVRSTSATPLSDSSRCAPDTAYGASKLAGDLAVAKNLAHTRADWCVLRPPLVYGPGNPGNMAKLLRLTQTGLPLPLGGLRSPRHLIFVGNLVDLIVHCLHHPRASRRTFLVSDGEALTAADLVKRLGAHGGRPVHLFQVPAFMLRAMGRVGDALSLLARRSIAVDSYSVERLLASLVIESRGVEEALSWTPPFSVDEGIRRTLQVELK
jgi:nucleoside-diphosphate-sugar epimerase